MDPCLHDSRKKTGGKAALGLSRCWYDVVMRSRIPLLALVFTIGLIALPQFAQAAGIPFFGPIIPQSGGQGVCAAGFGMFMDVINNIIRFSITIAIVFVAPLMIAYAGFLFVVNPVNASGKEQAKKILTNTVVGIVIALAGWMIVDAIMAALYNPGAESGTTKLQTWSSLITTNGASICIPLAASLKPGPGVSGTGTGSGIVTGSSTGKFTFDPGIDAQVATASGPLAELISCMANDVSAGVGRISSISDSVIISGAHDFKYCANQGGCSHTVNSCHYGGSGKCNGSSYAVDFGDEQNTAALTAAAQKCGGVVLNEGNHLHVSVGAANDCACDTRL